MAELHLFAEPSSPNQCLRWPQEIPHTERIVIRKQNRVLATIRDGSALSRFYHQKIKIENHVLILVSKGSLHIHRGGLLFPIDEGQAILLSNTEFEISEIGQIGSNAASFLLYFFKDHLLKSPLADDYEAFEKFHWIFHYPNDKHFTIIEPFITGPAEKMANGNSLKFISLVVCAAWNEMKPGFMKLVMDQIIIPRLAVQLFAESLVFCPAAEIAARSKAFPGGDVFLHKEIRRMGLGSLHRIVATTRRRWRKLWRYQGFERDLVIGAFKQPKQTKESEDAVPPPLENPEGQSKSEDPKNTPEESKTEKETKVPNFKALQLATMKEILKETNIIHIPGFERWPELLEAA